MRTGGGLDHFDRDTARAPQHGEIRRFARLTPTSSAMIAVPGGGAPCAHVALPELEAADAEAVVLWCAVLLDVSRATRAWRAAEDVVLVEPSRFDSSVTPSSSASPANCLEHIPASGHRLDDVVDFSRRTALPPKRCFTYAAGRHESTVAHGPGQGIAR